MASGSKWRTLGLATVGFNLSILTWFSLAPFASQVGEEFALSVTQLGILASAAIWLVPLGRILTGWVTDRYGAPAVFSFVLAYVGIFSIASAFAQSYAVFFALRLIVATAGITFVIGIQHVSQWFAEDKLGTAEGIYAGVGNAGAAAGALLLPRLFGVDWRSAFLWIGIASVTFSVIYYTFGEAAPTEAAARETAEKATLEGVAYTATRYGVIILALAYVMSYGLEVSMNSWLPTYFQQGFDLGIVQASTFAAVFALAAGLLRPFSGYISDWLERTERDVLPVYTERYREQWTIVCLSGIVLALSVLTLAGVTGNVMLTVGAVFFVGAACAWSSGAIFALVPSRFPERSGVASGVVGGVGTVGGIGYPLVFSYAAANGAIHYGYVAVALTMVPILLLNAWAYRSQIALDLTNGGVLDRSQPQPSSEAPVADD